MVFAGINYLAILIAAIVAFAWGAAYYMTLSKQWLDAAGRSKVEVHAERSPVPFIISIVGLIVMAWVLAGSIGHLGTGQVTLKNGIIFRPVHLAGLRGHDGVHQQRLRWPQVQALGARQHPLAGCARYRRRHHRRDGSVRGLKRPAASKATP